MTYQQGDVVFIKNILAPITIMYEHSGNYDSQYTGKDPDGNVFYFNNEDIINESHR